MKGQRRRRFFFSLKKLRKKCDPEIRMNTVLHGKDTGRRNTSSAHQAEIPSVTSRLQRPGTSGLGPSWMKIDSMSHTPETTANGTPGGRAPGAPGADTGTPSAKVQILNRAWGREPAIIDAPMSGEQITFKV